MALRDGGGPGRGRAARSRAGVVAVAAALYVAAGALATWPALQEARTSFLAAGGAGYGEAAPGDHLQTAYNLWLPGHQAARGAEPWRDPYSFSGVAPERTNFAGWPFALVWWPLDAALSTTAAWNAFVLLTYVGLGGLCMLWLRALDLPVAAALAGGLAFALAPYLGGQSAAGHLLAPISMLLPLALWAVERRRVAVAAAALTSIPLSGQVHLALGAIPFFVLYAVLRGRRGAAAAAVPAVAAGLLVWAVAVRGSVGAGGRSFAQVERYSAEWADFVSRDVRHGLESFVFLGWATPTIAVAGGVLLFLARRFRLGVALAVGAVVPIVLALGGNLPLYEPLWRVVPGLHETRVPERLMPIACLCIGALVAHAAARVRLQALVPLVLALVALDLRVDVYRPAAADEANPAYEALRREPPGRLLELPVHLPDRQEGSVYLYYAMQAPRERVLGYSTLARREADAAARELRSLNGVWRRTQSALFDEHGIRYVAVHTGGFERPPLTPEGGETAQTALLRNGFRLVSRGGAIALYAAPPPQPELRPLP